MAAKFTEQTVVWIGRDLSGISLKDLEEFFDDVAEVTSANISKTQIEVHFLGASAQAVIDQLNGTNVTARDGTGYILNLSVKRDDLQKDDQPVKHENEGSESVISSESSLLMFYNLPNGVSEFEIWKQLSTYVLYERVAINKYGISYRGLNGLRAVAIIVSNSSDAHKVIDRLSQRTITMYSEKSKGSISYEIDVRLGNFEEIPSHLNDDSEAESDSEDDQPVEHELIAHNVPLSGKLIRIFEDLFHRYHPKEVRILPMRRGSRQSGVDMVITFWNQKDAQGALRDLDGQTINIAGREHRLDLSRE
jgi:hypothetical protein